MSVFFLLEILSLSFRENDVRAEADDLYRIRLRQVDDPITHAWRCGKAAVNGGALNQR